MPGENSSCDPLAAALAVAGGGGFSNGIPRYASDAMRFALRRDAELIQQPREFDTLRPGQMIVGADQKRKLFIERRA